MRTQKTKEKRSKRQWYLLLIVIVTLALGWKYPLLGYSVPIVMISGIIGSFVWGRYICGNWCPRGAFLERVAPRLSSGDSVPSSLRSMQFRIIAMVLLMGLMLFRGLQKPTDPLHWGLVFWSLCGVTTLIAMVLAIIFKPRTWCTFCPIGTLENLIGGKKGQLRIDADACKDCKLCEKNCPSYISITSHRENGYLADRDCLKCSECILHCPKNALSWPQ